MKLAGRTIKLDIALLISGIILAAIGIFLWQDGLNTQANIAKKYPSYVVSTAGQTEEALGLSLAVLGGGSAIGGMVMMIVKRQK